MRIASCGWPFTCHYREGCLCLLPEDWYCERQYERIPIDQTIAKEATYDMVYDMDGAGGREIYLHFR
jgi:hypothetical protein